MPNYDYTTMRQYEAVRRSGKTNMLETGTVQRIAYESEFHNLVCFIEEADNEQYMEMAQRAAEKFRDRNIEEYVEQVPDEITVEVTL
jgi:hypothetical protein